MAVHYLHTKLRVTDLDAAVRFYEAAFGYTVRSRRPGPHESEIAFLVLPGETTELQLSQLPGGETVTMPARMVHLAFRVDDLDAVLTRALEAGAKMEAPPYTLPSGSRVVFLQDPHGYDIELVQKPS